MEMECGLSQLMDLPTDIPVQHQILESSYMDILPMSTVAGASEVQFFVKNNGDTFIDLSSSEIMTSFRVKKLNGNDLVTGDKVSVINGIGATLFNSIDCWLGDELVTERTPNQAFRAMVEILTSTGRDSIESWLQSALFYQDTPGQMDNGDPAPTTAGDPVNKGLKERYEFVKESKKVKVRSRIHSDLFTQPRPLINMVPLRLKFHINKSEYVLMSSATNPGFKLVLEEMILRLRFIKPAEKIYNALVTQTVLYPINRVKIREDVIPTGQTSATISNFVSGKLPTKLVIGLVTNEASNGDYKKNPFNFQHFNLTELSIVVNGNVLNGTPLKFDYSANDYEDGYWSLFTLTGKNFRDEGVIINRQAYKEGYALYGFHLGPSGCNIGDYKDPSRQGTINVTCRFKNATTETISLTAYLEYEGLIKVNAAKEVIADFAV